MRFSRESDAPAQCHLVVGLGNRGDQYAATRHNAGFMAADALAAEYGATNWRLRFDSLVAEKQVSLSGIKSVLVIVKPQTFMNNSGGAIKGLLRHYGLQTEQLCVIHDDIDLPPGTLRLKFGGGHGGHNGIRNIITATSANFTRIRIGVGSPPGRMDSADYVLQQLKGVPLEELRTSAAEAADAAAFLLTHSLQEAQNRFN